jgi:hypothetical protein
LKKYILFLFIFITFSFGEKSAFIYYLKSNNKSSLTDIYNMLYYMPSNKRMNFIKKFRTNEITPGSFSNITKVEFEKYFSKNIYKKLTISDENDFSLLNTSIYPKILYSRKLNEYYILMFIENNF